MNLREAMSHKKLGMLFTLLMFDKQKQKATEIELQMNAIDDQIQAVDADVEKEFEWSGGLVVELQLRRHIAKKKLGNQYNSLLKTTPHTLIKPTTW